jgi:predicted dehydrogenase
LAPSGTSTLPASGLRAGVLGARGIGAVHARELAALGTARLVVGGTTAASAVDTAQRLTRQLGRKVDPAKNLDDLRDRAADFVSICTPVELHAPHVTLLAGSGAFVFVEKPFLWDGARRAADLIEESRRLIAACEGRIAVNHPAVFLAESFLAARGALSRLGRLEVRYQTRGRHRGEMIAVDLLPHALSLLLVLAARTGATVAAPERVNIERGATTWAMVGCFGEVACRFDFVEDPTAPTSELSFIVDGIVVRRMQVAVENGVRVALQLDGRDVAIENPMTTALRRAVGYARAGLAPADDARLTDEVIGLMAGLLLD